MIVNRVAIVWWMASMCKSRYRCTRPSPESQKRGIHPANGQEDNRSKDCYPATPTTAEGETGEGRQRTALFIDHAKQNVDRKLQWTWCLYTQDSVTFGPLVLLFFNSVVVAFNRESKTILAYMFLAFLPFMIETNLKCAKLISGVQV